MLSTRQSTGVGALAAGFTLVAPKGLGFRVWGLGFRGLGFRE